MVSQMDRLMSLVEMDNEENKRGNDLFEQYLL